MNEPESGEHRELRELLGGYVLDALGPADVARVEEHLATCADCRAELDGVRPAAEALADLRAAGRPAADPALPPGLGERVLGAVEEVRRREARTRWTRVLGGSAVAAAAAAVVVVVGLRLGADPAPAVPLEAVSVDERAPGLDVKADLVAHTWGVEVQLQGRGFVAGERYRVSVRSQDGVEHAAGGFVGTGDRELDCGLSSSVLRAAATGFEVRDPSGTVLLSSSF